MILQKYVPAIAFSLMFIVFMVQVFCRYFLTPLTWSLEFTLIAFIWTTMFGACYARRDLSHVKFTLIYDHIKPGGRLIMRIAENILLVSEFLISLYPSHRYVDFMSFKVSEVLKIPMNIAFCPYIAFLLIMIGRLVYDLVIDFGKLFNEEKLSTNCPLVVFFLCFVLTFVLRIPIALRMIMSSIFYFALAPGPAAGIGMAATQFFSNMNFKFILLAVPLFVFAAKVMNMGGVTEMVFRFANTIVDKWRGVMGHVNVVASLIFSGMTGSAVADASDLGIMEIEAMRKHGYDDGFSCGVTTASATIGPIFPPSIPKVFYAMLSGASIGSLFMGGMIPGVLMAVTLMGYIAFIAKRRNYPKG